jgi:hypothetical protein
MTKRQDCKYLIIMMKFEKFRDIFAAKSRELLGREPNSDLIKKKYKGYKALVAFCKSDGKLQFKKRESGEIGYTFTPNTNRTDPGP